MIGVDPPAEICSRADCRAQATYRVLWRNPRIHAADRTKTWLACAEHVDYLRDYLAARNFPVRTEAHRTEHE